jgi:hypothetical protein
MMKDRFYLVEHKQKRIRSIGVKQIICQQTGGHIILTADKKAKQDYLIYLMMWQNWSQDQIENM